MMLYFVKLKISWVLRHHGFRVTLRKNTASCNALPLDRPAWPCPAMPIYPSNHHHRIGGVWWSLLPSAARLGLCKTFIFIQNRAISSLRAIKRTRVALYENMELRSFRQG